MTLPNHRRLSRRAFLKLSAAGTAGWSLPPALAAPPAPRLASTLRVPFLHQFVPDPETLLAGVPLDLDLLLVPAYVAAGLIRRGWLLPLAGPRDRAHDPEGAFTVPYCHAVSATLQPVGAALTDPWQSSAAWPSHGRLLLGAALQRRGYSPNDAHAGHIAEAAQDLANLRPILTGDPLVALRSGAVPAALALVLVTEAGALIPPAGLAATLPPWGGVLLEYDWVIPLSAPDAAAAAAFVRAHPPRPTSSHWPSLRLVPLTPLPERAQAQHTRLWAALRRVHRHSAD